MTHIRKSMCEPCQTLMMVWQQTLEPRVCRAAPQHSHAHQERAAQEPVAGGAQHELHHNGHVRRLVQPPAQRRVRKHELAELLPVQRACTRARAASGARARAGGFTKLFPPPWHVLPPPASGLCPANTCACRTMTDLCQHNSHLSEPDEHFICAFTHAAALGQPLSDLCRKDLRKHTPNQVLRTIRQKDVVAMKRTAHSPPAPPALHRSSLRLKLAHACSETRQQACA